MMESELQYKQNWTRTGHCLRNTFGLKASSKYYIVVSLSIARSPSIKRLCPLRIRPLFGRVGGSSFCFRLPLVAPNLSNHVSVAPHCTAARSQLPATEFASQPTTLKKPPPNAVTPCHGKATCLRCDTAM